MTRRGILQTRLLAVLALPLLLAACVHTPPVVVPPLGCPAGQHAVDGVCVPDVPPLVCPAGQHAEAGACVPDAPPPPPPPPVVAGPPYAVERVTDTLRAAPGGKGFQILDGTRVEIAWAYTCCVDSLAMVYGWPGFNRGWIDYLKPLGVRGVHFRFGPFLAQDEPNFRDIGGPYLEVNGKADLDHWNPRYWAFVRDSFGYAVANGFWIEADGLDGWGCKEGGYPHHPWNSQYNVQGEDAQTTCGVAVGPRHAALMAKIVDEVGSFGPVIFQDGNEIGIVGWGYKPEWTFALQRIVREREAANRYPVHMFGSNADKNQTTITSPLVDYVTTHDGAFLTGPIAAKPSLNNEHNPDFGIAGELQAYCQAKAGGASWGLWPSNLERDAFTTLLQKVQAGCEGVKTGACPWPQAPPDSATCHSYSAYHDGWRWDCTFKRHGQPIRPEGDPMRLACEEEAFGGDGSVAFSLTNATGDLTLGPVANNGQQFALYGSGAAGLSCTVQSAGAKNLCAGIRVSK